MLKELGIDWRALIMQLISFSIVFFVLWKYAYGPIFTMLQARREKIAESLANAEKIKADVARTEVERQKILADAGDKANKMIDEARQAAARVREQGNAKGDRRRRTNRHQGARGRHAGTRADARVIETRSRTAGRADDLDRHRKNSHGGRSKTARGRNRETIVRINL
jgi:hypothetical protein